MSLVSFTDFGRMCNVSAESIRRAVNSGRLNSRMLHGKKKIDTADKLSLIYLRSKAIKQKKADIKNLPEKVSTKEIQTIEEAAETYLISRAKRMQLAAIKQEIQNEILRGEYIETDLVNIYVFGYIEKLNDNLKRAGNSFLDDTANQIVKAGKLTNKIRDKFNSSIAGLIVDAKEDIKKMILKIQQEQQEIKK